MLPRQFAELPAKMRNESVRPYYELLSAKRKQLFLRRMLERPAALLLLAGLSPVVLLLAGAVCLDSPGGPFYRQIRVGELGRPFSLYKLRTMQVNAAVHPPLASQEDPRITRVGRLLRRWHLDELPQLLNIVRGEMSFVGPRPELPRFVAQYDPESLATLLVPPGLTGSASLKFSDEARYLNTGERERVYKDLILPRKNACNLEYLRAFSLLRDGQILLDTAARLLQRTGRNG